MCEFSDKVDAAKAAVPAVTPQEARARKAGEPEILFIDPRNAEDIRSTTGHIPGALNLPLGEIEAGSELPAELSSPERPIITACQGGPMGAIAAHALQQRGFRNVHFVDGGTQGWLDAGYDTVR
ncbi:MAG: rhodanese-like domain-containing protein [Gammaproteobacteria bacterium]|jgi:rhodanese-related sulfurtransferase|nr:rhodanese-like domain-containing protein [Gammaproteobacteria bacterium]